MLFSYHLALTRRERLLAISLVHVDAHRLIDSRLDLLKRPRRGVARVNGPRDPVGPIDDAAVQAQCVGMGNDAAEQRLAAQAVVVRTWYKTQRSVGPVDCPTVVIDGQAAGQHNVTGDY